MPGWQGQDNVLNVRNLEGKSTTTQLYLPTDEISRTQSYTIQQGQPEPTKTCKCGKCVIFILLILIIGIAVGIYFAVVSSGTEGQQAVNKASTLSKSSNDTYSDEMSNDHPKMKPTTVKDTVSTTESIPTQFSDVISTADHSELLPIPTITGQDIILRSVGNIGQNNTDDPLFSTDPLCRNQDNAAMFVFKCFNPHEFGSFPDNDTVKCLYLRQVGTCLELLVEERYRVTCNELDQLYVFKSSADLIKKSVKFDVIVQCPEWWDYYNDALNNTTDTVNHTLS
ncbi:uncharacterized protein LOC132561827 [Ylistrum balloti]|uniref:uncharacterized protein LOC132561827 n=1 Tax=Ylistrum balloti TaxID=509963 RepID=UPI002905EBAD|nr:uncharacterized protein LOC132561827 [Ylistrum balloti]